MRAVAARPPGVKRRPARRRAPVVSRLRAWFGGALRGLWADDTAGESKLRLDHRARAQAVLVHHLLPLGLYGLVTVVATYPLVRHLTTRVPGDGGDALMNLWGYWWVREALVTGQNPFFTPLLYAPHGAPLYLHTLNLFNGLATLPVQLAFGPIAAYNAVVFLSFVLAAYFAFLLVARVSGSRLAGFFGGVVYAFGSYHLAHLLGHANLLASEWLPAYLLCLHGANEARGRRRTLLVIAAAGALFLIALCDWQYVLFAGFFTAFHALYMAVAGRSAAPPLVAAAIVSLWCVVAAPLLAPTIAEVRSGDVALPPPDFARRYSADVLSFVVPSPIVAPNPFHRWRTPWTAPLDRRIAVPLVEKAIFLGWVPLALAFVALRYDQRRARFWILAALAFAVLALGPYLHVGGEWRFGTGRWAVPLPYGLLQRLPGLNIARVPARWGLLVTLCLAPLVGLGLVALARRFPALGQRRARLVLVPLLLITLLGEHLAVPYPLEQPDVPPFYRALAQSPEPGAVLEWPFCDGCSESRSNYYQTVHRRPLVGGYIARPRAYPLRSLPPFRAPDPAADIVRGEVAPEVGGWALAHAGVRWLVVLLDHPRLEPQALEPFLQRYAEPEPLWHDERTLVYRPLPPGKPTHFIEPDRGWYDVEGAPDGRQTRWFQSAASLNAWHFGPEPQAYALRFESWSFAGPRRLEIRVDGQSLGQWRVENIQRFDLPLTLTPGRHQIELRALDPPVSPIAAGVAGGDGRPLAFNIWNVELRR